MSLKIFYESLVNDEDGSIMGIHLVIKNKGKYLSIEDISIADIQDHKFIFCDEVKGEQALLDMTKQENVNKINDLIKKVLEWLN